MNLHSLKQFLRRRRPVTHAERHKAIIAPYRHWALMLALAAALAVVSLGIGVFQFFLVSGEQVIDTPELEQPEQLVDHARLRTVLEQAQAQERAYEELRGSLPEAPERAESGEAAEPVSTDEQPADTQTETSEEVNLISD